MRMTMMMMMIHLKLILILMMMMKSMEPLWKGPMTLQTMSICQFLLKLRNSSSTSVGTHLS
uniref:Alternative protein IFT46 n=1 Tax=Homo sapiens TaxID=9606 RepID=L8E8J4_HUMAN|nr:alternative protein IFT46 [Homo sapiens]